MYELDPFLLSGIRIELRSIVPYESPVEYC